MKFEPEYQQLLQQLPADIPRYTPQDILKTSDQNIRELLSTGSGAFVIEKVYPLSVLQDLSGAIDQMNHLRQTIESKATRVWDFLAELCSVSPELWINYFADPTVHKCFKAWLGCDLRYSAQLNTLEPGYVGRWIHRDYPAGMTPFSKLKNTPHEITNTLQYFSIQGLIAHHDIHHGALRILPGSHNLRALPILNTQKIAELFNKYSAEIKMNAGDVLVYNPSLIHCAGNMEQARFDRTVTLLQITSRFLIPMEKVNREKIQKILLPIILHQLVNKQWDTIKVNRLLEVALEPSPFPQDLKTISFSTLGPQHDPHLEEIRKLIELQAVAADEG